ncbi:MAG: hypothetical protein NXI32_08615 [bacterium]|nr:hypothetical protein [bacterium]
MIHYSCDRCGCVLGKDQAIRYVVRMEMEAKLNLDYHDDIDDDQDCLLEMDQMLDKLESEFSDAEELDEEHLMVHHRKVFDLCPACFRKFSKNPVGQERISPFGFSHN